MTTPRRSVLAAIAGVPIAAAVSASPEVAASLGNLAGMSQADLLELGSRNADATFAALCADALRKATLSDIAERLLSDAEAAAEADAPFPLALKWTERTQGEDGQPLAFNRQWRPQDVFADADLRNLACAEARRRGVAYSRSIEADLRSQFDAWRASRDIADARHGTPELLEQAEATDGAACAAFWRVAEYPAPNAEALLVKLHLRRARVEGDSEQEQWAEIAADLERVLVRVA